MQDERDRDLNTWLSCYRVTDDAASDEVLLERIVTVASATPREISKPFWSSFWVSAWMADAVAFAAVATLGFWVGAVSPQAMASDRVTTVSVSSADAGDEDRMVFGAQSWGEVTL